LVDEVRAASGRVVISSEDFASARIKHVRKLVEDLGADRVHVLIVARRLDKLLPSAWQERVKSVNETRTYDAWLREVLGTDRAGAAARTFWHNHGLQGLVERWTSTLAPERVLVLVNDESDRRFQPATFEHLLGLDDGSLTPGPHVNTSLSMERIELCRQVNLAAEARGWVGLRKLNGPRRAMLAGLRAVPAADFETMIPPLPAWTGPRLVELSDERARWVAESGVQVVGDPELLRHTGDPDAPELGVPPRVLPVEAAASAIEHALLGVLKREAARSRRRAAAPKQVLPRDPVAEMPGRSLLRELARRQKARVRRVGRGDR
jgi:hypothetical protein